MTKQSKQSKAAIINCNGALDPDRVYGGIVDALAANVAEVNIVVERGGKAHFTSCNIMAIHEMIRAVADKFSETFNTGIGANDAN